MFANLTAPLFPNRLFDKIGVMTLRLRFWTCAILTLAIFSTSADARLRSKEILKMFAGGKPEDRARLADAVAHMQTKESFELLLKSYDPKEVNAKDAAAIAEALGLSGNPRAALALVAGLDQLRSTSLELGELTPNQQTLRLNIVTALGQLGGGQAEAALIESLSDKDSRVVLAAIRALGRLKSKDAVPALLQLAAQGGDTAREVFEAFALIGDPREISTLEAGLQSPDKFLELAAEYALSKIGRMESTAKLENEISSDPGMEKVSIRAAYYLLLLDHPSGLTHLDKLARHPDYGFAVLAIEAIGRAGNSRGIPILVEIAKSPDASVRAAVAAALGQLGGSKALSVLRKLHEDESPLVVHAATLQLSRMGEID